MRNKHFDHDERVDTVHDLLTLHVLHRITTVPILFLWSESVQV